MSSNKNGSFLIQKGVNIPIKENNNHPFTNENLKQQSPENNSDLKIDINKAHRLLDGDVEDKYVIEMINNLEQNKVSISENNSQNMVSLIKEIVDEDQEINFPNVSFNNSSNPPSTHSPNLPFNNSLPNPLNHPLTNPTPNPPSSNFPSNNHQLSPPPSNLFDPQSIDLFDNNPNNPFDNNKNNIDNNSTNPYNNNSINPYNNNPYDNDSNNPSVNSKPSINPYNNNSNIPSDISKPSINPYLTFLSNPFPNTIVEEPQKTPEKVLYAGYFSLYLTLNIFIFFIIPIILCIICLLSHYVLL